MENRQAAMFKRLMGLLIASVALPPRRVERPRERGGRSYGRGTVGVAGAFGSIRDRRSGNRCRCPGCVKAAKRKGAVQ